MMLEFDAIPSAHPLRLLALFRPSKQSTMPTLIEQVGTGVITGDKVCVPLTCPTNEHGQQPSAPCLRRPTAADGDLATAVSPVGC